MDSHAADNRRRGARAFVLVVNTQQRELLVRGLDAIAAERAALPFETEVLVLDNASDDGSADAARAHATVDEVIALTARRGKAENDSELLRRAAGRYGLLLNEDSELQPGATAALHAALEDDPHAAAAGARLLRPDGTPQPSAWRFPTPLTALAGALFLHRRYTVQSCGERTRRVDWAQSAALLVRARGRGAGRLPRPGVLRLLRRGRLLPPPARRRLAHALRAAAARVHHEQLSTGAVPERRIVEMSRNRDRYMRKHHSRCGRARGARADRAHVRARAPRRRSSLPGHDAAPLLAPRHRDAAPRSRRGAARGRRGTQPRGQPVTDR